MKGCLKYFVLFVSAIVVLVCLANGSASAIMFAFGIVALIVYTEIQSRLAEKRHQIAIAEAQERERKKAIADARKRSDLFNFNPSVGLEEVREYARKKNPVRQAEAIQKRYEMAKAALDDAILVINDDIDQLYKYRKQLHKEVIKNYEIAIQPFKEELSIKEDKIPKPKNLRSAENYTFPESMQPKLIQKEINREISSISNEIGLQINSFISSHGGFSNIKNIKKGEAAVVATMVGIELAVAFIRQKKELEHKLTEVEKLKVDVDKCCNEFAGKIKTLGVVASEVQYLRKLHDDAVYEMMQYYDTVKELANKKKSLDQLGENEVKAVESFYVSGKILIRLIHTNITTLKLA